MQLVVDDWESYAPITLQSPPLSDEEFLRFCERYPDYQIECTAEGEIVIMPPNYSKGSYRNSLINIQLGSWARADGRGWVFDSSGGYVLPNGARRSPDASWVSKSRAARLPEASREAFFRLSPEFVVELKSSTEGIKKLQAKMVEWMENGTELGWLIDPDAQVVWVYRPRQAAERLDNPARLHGEGPVAGFVLELKEVWQGFQNS
jgi:Uma2 family endonuclease